MNRKIVIEKNKQQKEKTRTLVELDNDVHRRIAEIAFETNRPMREVASLLIRDALEHVEIKEGTEE